MNFDIKERLGRYETFVVCKTTDEIVDFLTKYGAELAEYHNVIHDGKRAVLTDERHISDYDGFRSIHDDVTFRFGGSTFGYGSLDFYKRTRGFNIEDSTFFWSDYNTIVSDINIISFF